MRMSSWHHAPDASGRCLLRGFQLLQCRLPSIPLWWGGVGGRGEEGPSSHQKYLLGRYLFVNSPTVEMNMLEK